MCECYAGEIYELTKHRKEEASADDDFLDVDEGEGESHGEANGDSIKAAVEQMTAQDDFFASFAGSSAPDVVVFFF